MESDERNQIEQHYQPLVEAIVERWAIGKPPNPSPFSTSSKPSGYFRLRDYLLNYLVTHQAFPAGVHAMPEGRDIQGNIEPSFPIDFNEILKGFTLPK
ncbi:MAG: hypothetical protein HGB36_12860 [Chlorobiaceae bacterium]|nr:hypothetical protein [Chlorobiaceae bacterium]